MIRPASKPGRIQDMESSSHSVKHDPTTSPGGSQGAWLREFLFFRPVFYRGRLQHLAYHLGIGQQGHVVAQGKAIATQALSGEILVGPWIRGMHAVAGDQGRDLVLASGNV